MARKMKDSRVPWIGEVPENWKIERNKNMFACSKSIIGENWEHAQLLSLTTKGIREKDLNELSGKVPDSFETYQVVKSDDVVMCLFDLDCSAVFSGLSKYNGMISPAYKVLNCKKDILPYYADFWFSFIFDGRKFKPYSKNLRYTLNYNEFAALPALIPPITEQQRIVDFLDNRCSNIDRVLGEIRVSIEEYKKLKQAIITQAVTKGIRGDRPMKNSGIEWVKEIPVEWDIIPSKYVFSNSDERKRPDDELLTASQKHGIISQQKYMEKEDTRIVLANKGIEDWKHVEPYDFIISLRSFQGGLEMSEISGCITWHYIVLKAKMPLHSFYFKWLFKSELYIKALQRTCNFIRDGQDLRYSNFTQVPLFIPPMAEQIDIANYLGEKCAEIDALIERKSRLLSELEAYKKSLIYEYVTGKKGVPQAHSEAMITFVDARALLMCRIIELLKPKGRIHLMKALFSVDCQLDLNMETQYVRQKHGPYDERIEEYEEVLIQKGWVSIKRGSSVEYILTETFETYREAYQTYYGNVDAEIQRICEFLRPMKTSQAERVATLLAVWNDFIINGITPTDKQIVQEVRGNWTPNKANSPESTWMDTLTKMRAYQIQPSGYGKHTAHMGESRRGVDNGAN